MSAGWRKRGLWLRRLAALLLGGLLSVAAGELALRATLQLRTGTTTDRGGYSGEWMRHHPTLGWLPRANARVRHRTTEFDVEITIDPRGFRQSREVPVARTPGVPRVVLLGGSFVFGQGVEESDALGARLAAGRADLEVVAMGVPGWGTDQVLLAWRELEGPHRRADTVVLAFLPEHVVRNGEHSRHGRGKPWFELSGGELWLRGVPVPTTIGPTHRDVDARRPGVPLPFKAFLRRHSRLYAFLGRHFGAAARAAAGDRRDPYPEIAAEGPAWDVTRAIVAELALAVAVTGARLHVAIVPEPWHLEPGAPGDHQAAVVELCRELGVPCLDLTPVFREASPTPARSFYRRADGHWNERGHKLAAEALAVSLLGD